MTTGHQTFPRLGSNNLLPGKTVWRWFIKTLVPAAALAVSLGFAAETVTKEYQLKAAFIYNFTKFVDWPVQRSGSKDRPFTIGVFGKNPFGDELNKLAQGRSVNGRSMVIKNITSTNEAVSVDLLFVSSGQEESLGKFLITIQGEGVLTIGESKSFAEYGGIINFVTEADKIRFEINLDEAERGGLKLRAQLLKLAKNVRRKAEPAQP